MVEQAKLEVIASPQFRGEADLPNALQNVGGTAPDEQGSGQASQPATGQQNQSSGGAASGGSAQPTTPSVPEDGTEAEKPQPDKDYQLSRALDLLHGIALIEASKAN